MRILFCCTGNSCRSQMAEGLLRHHAAASVEVYSAGTRPVGIHPLVPRVMEECGVAIAGQTSKGIGQVPSVLDLVVTLCGDAAENCPSFGGAQIRHWPIPDPAGASGDEAEILEVFRRVRDELRERVVKLLRELGLSRGSSPAVSG